MNPKQNTSKSNSDGCLWIFLLGFFSFISYGFLKIFFPLPNILINILSVVISIQLVIKTLGKPHIKSIFKNGVLIFIFIFGFQFIASFLSNSLKDFKPEKTSFNIDEGVKEVYTLENKDSILLYTSHRQWKDNYGNDFNGKLSVRKKDYLQLKNHIETYKIKTSENFWGNLYQYIEQKDTPSLDLVMNTFTEILKSKKLNQMQFAEMVVTCIQDIPYSLVLQKECLAPEAYEDDLKRILTNCPDCCIGNIKYGIQNPVSFLQNLKGDCDTRTVLIYSILKYFKYDVAIANSTFYKHSIIAINLPSTGLHKIYNGKKYYLWETTAKYYELGKLSSNFNNVTHWNIVLTSK